MRITTAYVFMIFIFIIAGKAFSGDYVKGKDIITLKCSSDNNKEGTFDLTIDFNNMGISLGYKGFTIYDIVNVDDTYLTGYQNKIRSADAYKSGGEVIMINRISGHYKRAAVGIFGVDSKFRAFIFEGQCDKPVF
jgi:hypothetical protein